MKQHMIFLLLSFVSYLTIQAQNTGMIAQMQEEEQSAIQAIALYPQKERTAILEASTHPEILVRMENIRRNYGPRHSGATVQPVLRSFEEEHKSAVPADWFKDPENRVERIKEYGKLRIDYDEAVRVAADKAPTEREFLKDNVDRYPALKPALKQPVQKQPQPARLREYEPFPNGLPEKYVPKEKVIEHEKIPRPETIDRAKETHEKAWDKIKSQPRYTPPRPPQQTAPPRQAPSKAPSQPRQSAPPRKN
jgi:hypothetical protein